MLLCRQIEWCGDAGCSWSESEIDEWTETTGIQGTKTENESYNADHEGHDMLFLVVFGEINLILDLQAKLRQGEEREECSHQHCDIEVRIITKVERNKVEGKQALDEHPRQIDALDAEEASRQDDDEEGEKH